MTFIAFWTRDSLGVVTHKWWKLIAETPEKWILTDGENSHTAFKTDYYPVFESHIRWEMCEL